jgi:AcrR family transcriptional regulator
MPGTNRRTFTRKSDARPGELRTAALRLFAHHGYGGTTIDDIAKAADVTVGTIYRYFRDKQALLHAIVEWTATDPLLTPEEVVLAGDPKSRLRHLAQAIWNASRREPHVHLIRLLLAESGNAPELVEQYRVKVLEPTERIIADAIDQMGPSGNTTVVARAVVGGLLGASVLAGSPSAPTPIVPQLAPLDLTVDTLLGAWLGKRAPAPSPPTTEPPRRDGRPRGPDSW